jgi:hypothetical protein
MPVTPLDDWRDVVARRCVLRGLLERCVLRGPLERDVERVARFDFGCDRELLAVRLGEALLRRAGVLPLRRADPVRRAAGRVVWAM